MKKIFVAGLSILFALGSCKKDSAVDPDGARGTLIASINAVAIDFNYSENMIMDSVYDYGLGGTYYFLSVSGEYKNGDKLDIVVNSRSPITTTTYPCTSSGMLTSIGFTKYGATFAESYQSPFRDSTGREFADGNIRITEISSTHVKGTFSATAGRESSLPYSIVISDGSFDFLR
jgi:hypothetical protein